MNEQTEVNEALLDAAANEELHEKLTAAEARGDLKFVSKSEPNLPPIPYDWNHIMELCVQRQFASKTLTDAYIVLPVSEHMDTKKNKMRLVQNDASSPLGTHDKSDSFARLAYQPFACAKFKTDELIRWLVSSGKVTDVKDSSVS